MSVEQTDTTLTIARSISAPAARIWQALSDPKGLAVWWGPDGFTTTTHEMDFRVGGVWRYTMHGPDGTDYPNRVRYEELDEPRRLAYLHDNDSDNDPGHFRTTLTLVEADGTTTVTLRMECASEALRAHIAEHGAIEGGQQTLARLDAFLAKASKGAAAAQVAA